jgi:two-component system response regulator NreC
MTFQTQGPKSDPIQILIADDHGVLRAGLRALLSAEPDMQVVGEAADGQETLHMANELCPDVVLLDISMPGLGGVETTRQLTKNLPDARVLILTVHEDEHLLREVMRAGAAGYVTKRAIEPELLNAIHAVWRGDLYVHPTMTRALLETLSSPPIRGEDESEDVGADEDLIEALTPREIEVLRLIAQGYTNRQASEVLCIGVRTVETHRANLMAKLGLRGRVALVRYARERGLI